MKNEKVLLIILFLLKTNLSNSQLVPICDYSGPVSLSSWNACNYNPWVSVFEDNFNGNKLDFSKWKLPVYGSIRDPEHLKEQQWYANSNSTPYLPYSNNLIVNNGMLTIHAYTSPLVGTFNTQYPNYLTLTELFNITSGEIESKYKFGYGKYEICCKIPQEAGCWPAFWLYGADPNNAGVSSEIDIFEFWKNDYHNHNMTIHYPDYGTMCLTDYNGPNYSAAFHTFTLEYDEYNMYWYVDGGAPKRIEAKFMDQNNQAQTCYNINNGSNFNLLVNKIYPKDPSEIIINLAINSAASGYQPNPSNFDADFKIQYVRYSKKMDCPGAVTITSWQQLNIKNNEYNVIIGTTITLKGSAHLGGGEQLKVIARDEIIIEPNFNTYSDDFIAIIDPLICDGVARKGKSENLESAFQSSDLILSNLMSTLSIETNSSSNPIVSTYPNPTDDIFTIEFKENAFLDCETYILNGQNKVVLTQKTINTSKLQIDFGNYAKDVYTVYIYNRKTKKATVNKVVCN